MKRKKRPNQPKPEEVENEATELPNREVMTLIDPNMLGGGLLGATGAPSPTSPGSQAPITQSSTGTSLLDRFMPKTPPGTDQPYQPTTSSTAES